VSMAYESDIFDDPKCDLDATRSRLLASKNHPDTARDWLKALLTDGSPVNEAYETGRYKLGKDVQDLVWAFDGDLLKCDGRALEDVREIQLRAYSRLMNFLLANYEYRAASAIKGMLRHTHERWWLRNRHFLLWRLLAGAVAGNIALGGSSTWREAVVALSLLPACGVIAVSLLLIFLPALATELFQAPRHMLHKWSEIMARLRIVWTNALGIVAFVGVFEWLVALNLRTNSWLVAGNWKFHLLSASVSLAIGYVVNVIWRERSIAGPS